MQDPGCEFRRRGGPRRLRMAGGRTPGLGAVTRPPAPLPARSAPRPPRRAPSVLRPNSRGGRHPRRRPGRTTRRSCRPRDAPPPPRRGGPLASRASRFCVRRAERPAAPDVPLGAEGLDGAGRGAQDLRDPGVVLALGDPPSYAFLVRPQRVPALDGHARRRPPFALEAPSYSYSPAPPARPSRRPLPSVLCRPVSPWANPRHKPWVLASFGEAAWIGYPWCA